MGPPEPGGLILTSRCRDLRRALTPVAWTVLEEMALDAVTVEGRIAAATSSRRIAAQLDLDAGTAATALRLLGNRRLIELERCSGPAGRFGLSAYVLLDTPGIRLFPPCGDPPRTQAPCTAGSHREEPSSRHDRRRPAPDHRTDEVDGQAAFNLDW